MINGRFAISVHILTLLEIMKGELLSSTFIASSININPVLVRKEIAHLKKAGLVNSKEGKNGGCFLNKNAQDINFADLFKSIYPNPILSFSKKTPNTNCPIGKRINIHLEKLYNNCEMAMYEKLRQKNLLEFSQQFNK